MRRPIRNLLGAIRPLENRLAPAIMDFTLAAPSTLVLGGNLNGQNFVEQSPGSLTTTYSGTVQVNVDFTAGTISFLDAAQGSFGLLDAAQTGTYQPAPGGGAGSAPGDYGGAVPAFGLVFAVRDSNAQLGTPTALTLTGTGAATFLSTQTLFLTGGVLDYNAGALGMGVTSLAGNTGANVATTDGSFTDLQTGEARLTIPLNVTLTDTVGGLPITYTINGTLNGLSPFAIADLNGAASGVNSSVTYWTGWPAMSIAPDAIVRRMPANTLDSLTITLTNRPDGVAESLSITALPAGITSSGYDSSTGTLVLSGAASLADYQQALRAVSYGNTLMNGTNGDRTITVVANDGVISGFASNAIVSVIGGGTAPTVTGTQVNGNSNAQRSLVQSLAVTFSSVVSFQTTPGAAFTLTRNGGGAVNFTASAATVGSVTVVTLNAFTGAEAELNGALKDGNYTLMALASQISAGGTNMAANYTFGGVPADNLFRFYGDVTGDRRVDISDFGFFSAAYLQGPGANNPFLDFNSDGRIDITDFGQFSVRYFTTLP